MRKASKNYILAAHKTRARGPKVKSHNHPLRDAKYIFLQACKSANKWKSIKSHTVNSLSELNKLQITNNTLKSYQNTMSNVRKHNKKPKKNNHKMRSAFWNIRGRENIKEVLNTMVALDLCAAGLQEHNLRANSHYVHLVEEHANKLGFKII